MGEWQQGLFGCFSDCKLCIFTYFCPCIVFGKTAEKVGESCGLCGCALFVPIANFYALIKVRGLIRESKAIEGSCFNDCLMIYFCGLCSLVQMAKEVDATDAGQAMARE